MNCDENCDDWWKLKWWIDEKFRISSYSDSNTVINRNRFVCGKIFLNQTKFFWKFKQTSSIETNQTRIGAR